MQVYVGGLSLQEGKLSAGFAATTGELTSGLKESPCGNIV